MTVLMGDDIGLREGSAFGPESRLKLFIETEIDVNHMIFRVERSNLRGGVATSCGRRGAEKHGVRFRVTHTSLLELGAQYACTLLTKPTIRQSSRAFASAPVWQFWATVLGCVDESRAV